MLRSDAHQSFSPPESQTANELEILDNMKAVQLKALCKERGLNVTGKKDDLIERLREHFTNVANGQDSQSHKDDLPVVDLRDADNMKAAELKALCKERGLKVTGKKADLIERLREHFTSVTDGQHSRSQKDDIDSMSEDGLRHALVARGLSGLGTKQELLIRYRQDIQMLKEMHEAAPPTGRDGYLALSRVLDEAAKSGGVIADYLANMKAKSNSVPKFIEVTITSLGLVPQKYTVGGAPSVTADVLRELAGDPFADPPKYGSVSSREAGAYIIRPESTNISIVYHSTGFRPTGEGGM
jgi:SAP domain/LETM1-like protein